MIKHRQFTRTSNLPSTHLFNLRGRGTMPATRRSTTDHYVFHTRSYLETEAKAAVSSCDTYIDDLLTGVSNAEGGSRNGYRQKRCYQGVCYVQTSSTDNCRSRVSLIALDNFHRIVRLLPQWNITN